MKSESDVPYWFDASPTVLWSEYDTWQDVARWAEPMYQAPRELSPELTRQINRIKEQHSTPELRLQHTLQWVQSEIRYLGFEIGEGSHKPTHPSVVFQRKFGDCKDKTLLTVTMLQQMGIDAKPALVNTNIRRGIADLLPSPSAFDHVLIHAKIGDQMHWLDPTKSDQLGALEHIHQPNFGLALVLDSDSTGLVPMDSSVNQQRSKLVEVTLDGSKGFDQPVDYKVVTTTQGARAESLRYSLKSSTLDDFQKQYLNYYAGYFPEILAAAPLTVNDDTARNRIVTTERYTLGNISKESATKGRFIVDFETPDTDDLLRDPESKIRISPLGLVHPTETVVKTTVLLPEEWPIELVDERIEHAAFVFERKLTQPSAKRIAIVDRYQSKADSVAAADMPDYLAKLAAARDHTGYQLTWSKPAVELETISFWQRFNWLIAFVGLVAVAFWLWLARKTYQWDPEPAAVIARPNLAGINGWLLLPVIGLFIAVPMVAYTTWDNMSAYSIQSWSSVAIPGGENYNAIFAPALLFELITNIGLLIMGMTLMLLFFRKRTSTPRVYIAFLIALLLVATVSHLYGRYLPTPDDERLAEVSILVGSSIRSALWILYFLVSDRVKATFVRRRGTSGAGLRETPTDSNVALVS